MSKNERMVGISRRTLVKSTAIGSLALAAGGFSLPFTLRNAAASVQQAREKVVWGACSVNCGSRCALRLHVKDNEVTWVETDNTGSDEYGNHQVRACLRGRSIRRRINHPDRLNYPMKRVGKRGEGKFERITAILMCYSRPAHKRCGSTPLMLRHAVSVMAIPCGYLTIMEKC